MMTARFHFLYHCRFFPLIMGESLDFVLDEKMLATISGSERNGGTLVRNLLYVCKRFSTKQNAIITGISSYIYRYLLSK